MNFTMGGLKPTVMTEGLGGNSFNSTHLTRTYGLDKPHDLSANEVNMAQLFSATDRYNDKPLIGMTEAKGKKTYLTSDQYTWKLRGHQKQKLRVVQVVETSTTPGLNQQNFTIVLDKGWFKQPDVIIGENNNYPLEVIGEPKRTSVGWEYTVRLQTDDDNLSFPVGLIQLGKEFNKVGTSVGGEMNQDYGTMQFNSVFELRGQLGYVAEEVTMTDKALRIDKNSNNRLQKIKHWNVPFYNNEGKMYTNFMPMAEAEVWNNIYTDIEWALNFGKKSIKVTDQGYLKRTGAGLRQQLEEGHVLEHNGNLTLSRLDEWLTSIYRGRKDARPENRKIVLSTGEAGAIMFDNMVQSDASNFLTVDSHFISGNDFRHLSYGVQFTHYRGKNGLDVTVMLDPAKDNPEWCPQTHPIQTDTCIDSWRMDILDFGSTKNQDTGEMGSNISMVCEQNGDVYFSSVGKWDPETGNPITDGGRGQAGGVGGYAVHVEKSFGLLIKDISRCGVIKLSFDN